jgi:predicted DNA-binding transcriptional regulator AlpA
MTMRPLSTKQVAQKLGIDQGDLQRRIKRGTVPCPPLQQVGGLNIRLWTAEDVARLRKALVKGRKKRKQS